MEALSSLFMCFACLALPTGLGLAIAAFARKTTGKTTRCPNSRCRQRNRHEAIYCSRCGQRLT